MIRYTEFEEDQSEQESFIKEDPEGLVCVKNLIAQANPLMNKI